VTSQIVFDALFMEIIVIVGYIVRIVIFSDCIFTYIT